MQNPAAGYFARVGISVPELAVQGGDVDAEPARRLALVPPATTQHLPNPDLFHLGEGGIGAEGSSSKFKTMML